ncbi:UxaA family hydrolase [Paenibacillus thalictri]|uniref:D-galactarate dehydratase n=1 Tax=Paenibacillus thalictri TaxID=2527873 RepID=A0A4Q9DM30_9BACL|nr:UxaA family hydrolase [Paenibacillus thalictri]TBL75112.1 D-galactarate dehydratase [Paenibacillus thalictri]
MAAPIAAGADALVMDTNDHVATAIKDLQAGSTVTFRVGDEAKQLTLQEPVPFGHKFAILDIAPGTDVRKYGEVIGRTTIAISAGYHVHVHNVEGIRGRGDQAKTTG